MKFINLKTASVLIAVRASAQDTQEEIAAGTGKASALEIDAAVNTDLITEIAATGGDETEGRRLMNSIENKDPTTLTLEQSRGPWPTIEEAERIKRNSEIEQLKDWSNEYDNRVAAKKILGTHKKSESGEGGYLKNMYATSTTKLPDLLKKKEKDDQDAKEAEIEAEKARQEAEKKRKEDDAAAAALHDAAANKRTERFEKIVENLKQNPKVRKNWEEANKNPNYATSFDDFVLPLAQKRIKAGDKYLKRKKGNDYNARKKSAAGDATRPKKPSEILRKIKTVPRKIEEYMVGGDEQILIHMLALGKFKTVGVPTEHFVGKTIGWREKAQKQRDEGTQDFVLNAQAMEDAYAKQLASKKREQQAKVVTNAGARRQEDAAFDVKSNEL